MSVQTVLGPVSRENLGLTLMHEHVFMDLRRKFDATDLLQSDELVTKDKIELLHRNHRLLKDNLFLADENVAREEIQKFKCHGGGTIVCMSDRGMGGNPEAMRRLSKEVDIHVVECTGFYTDATHPEYMYDKTPEEMADLFVRDIEFGIDDTGIRAGIIGEIGTSAQITDREWKVLRAACIAQRKTGASISVHIDPWRENGLEVCRFIDENGGDLSRTIIDHVDAVINLTYCKALLKYNVTIEFDNFGKQYQTPGLHFDTDDQRIAAIAELIAEGYEEQILLSTDVCLKTDLSHYGGNGYGHIPGNIIPLMRKRGIPDRAIHSMTVLTPGRLLDK